MASKDKKYRDEIERIRAQYALYDEQQLGRTVWSPFNEDEVAHRSQQVLSFATVMRSIGRIDLGGLQILDVGCGGGRVLRTYLDMGAAPDDLVGVDVNEIWLGNAKKLSPHLSFQATDGTSLDFANESFDLVTQYVAFSSIALAELRQRLASEMWRVLKPGGYVFWWDMRHMAAAAGGQDIPLKFEDLFPGPTAHQLWVAATQKPSETLRAFRANRMLGTVLDGLGKTPTHIAALIGPKA